MATSLELARHLSDRLGYGPGPGDLNRIAALGAESWIESQLHPEKIPVPKALQDGLDRLPNLKSNPAELFLKYGGAFRASIQAAANPGGTPSAAQREANAQLRALGAEAVAARFLGAVHSPRQLEENLAEFWFNHFNVFGGKGLVRIWFGAYEHQAIRPHVLGRFRDLLTATARHPAMLFYLDNWQNTAPGSPGARGQFTGINENYARELMELHTMGVDGGYTQTDVQELARILTGWGLGGRRRRLFRDDGMERGPPGSAFAFDQTRHDTGDKKLLGRTIKGGGMEEVEQAIGMLARHPSTASHISYKLAQWFLADRPDGGIVTAMAATFQRTDGDIREVLRTLFTSEAFLDPRAYGAKFKTPVRYVVSAARATGHPVRNVLPLYAMTVQLGQAPYLCVTPDGYKCTEDAWLNPEAMTRRISFAVALGGGYLPLTGPMDINGPDMNAMGSRRPEDAMDRRMERETRRTGGTPGEPRPVDLLPDPDFLRNTLGDLFSDNTKAALRDSPAPLRAGMILGSPEFMRC